MTAAAADRASRCPACDGPLDPWRSDLPGLDPGDRARYALARCGSCGTAVTLGAPPGPERYETGIYRPQTPRLAATVAAAKRLAHRQPVALLRRAGLAPGSRVLDAGAGRGRLVASLRRAGFHATGLEPSARGRASARAGGLPVCPGTVESHQAAGLDAVVLWHVLEHLEDPAGALGRVAGWLVPGGVVLLAVPNLASAQARLGGPGWLHLDLPRHRTHFTPPGLRAIATRAGLSPGATHHLVWEHNPAGMWMALTARLGLGEPGLAFHLLKRTLPPSRRRLGALTAGLPLVLPAAAGELVAGLRGCGGTVAMVARKPAHPPRPAHGLLQCGMQPMPL